LARSFVFNFFRQAALRFDEQAFLHNAFVLFKRTLDAVYVIAVSIRHLSDDPIIPTAFGAKKQIRNPGHHFPNAELAHRFPLSTTASSAFDEALASRGSATEEWKNAGYFLACGDFLLSRQPKTEKDPGG
jgi:hypothetical protein